MKKLLVLLGLGVLLTGCVKTNRDLIPTKGTFDYAEVQLPSGEVIKGKVKAWADFPENSFIKITFKDGRTVLTHISNAVLIENDK